MNRRTRAALIEIPASLIFAGGIASAALLDRVPLSPLRLLNDRDSFGVPGYEAMRSPDLLQAIARPTHPVLWALLGLAVLAALLHMAIRLRIRFAYPLQIMISAGMALGGLWPWLAVRWPVSALLVAGAAAGLLVSGMLTEPRVRRHWSQMFLGVIAAWLVIAGLAAMGTAMHDVLRMGGDLPALFVLLAMSLIGARVQMLIGSNVTFSLTLIWAMIGIASVSLGGTSMTIPTAAVVGIASLAVVIVRVTT